MTGTRIIKAVVKKKKCTISVVMGLPVEHFGIGDVVVLKVKKSTDFKYVNAVKDHLAQLMMMQGKKRFWLMLPEEIEVCELKLIQEKKK
jgi:hypothetical protein